ncbi:hypothetical protein D3C85_1834790 [compost metagenome]
MNAGQANDQAAIGAEVGTWMAPLPATKPVRMHPLEQFALDRTLQRRGLLQGNQ